MATLDRPLREFASKHADRLKQLESRPDELQAEARVAAKRIGLVVAWL